jgi:hypothetical protein
MLIINSDCRSSERQKISDKAVFVEEVFTLKVQYHQKCVRVRLAGMLKRPKNEGRLVFSHFFKPLLQRYIFLSIITRNTSIENVNMEEDSSTEV